MFSDSLGQYLQPSFSVYDSVTGHTGKYIFALFKLKANYLESDEQANLLKQLTMQLLYTRYNPDSYSGVAKYIYQDGHNKQVQVNHIGSDNP
ncbi:hypothetical protein [Paraflavitalea speifideaquila]|uniref:hypothetical protein n=1 Tax=Paraflavitalea speifideaquila TaxID=3076558 RepID=UPI0028E787C2|nr:hypothetical protein [Paraflavitalea speifideiaquila]